MTTLTKKAIAWILAHPLICSLVAILIAVAGVWGMTGIKTDNTLESWFDPHDKNLAQYNDFSDKFGSEQFILVITRRADIYDSQSIAADHALAAKFDEIDGIRDVLCMSRVLEELDIDETDAKKYFANMELFKRTLIAKDGKSIAKNGTSCAQFLMLEKDISERRGAIMADTYRVLLETFDNESEWSVTGATPINVEINVASSRQTGILMPCMIGLSALILLVIFRRLSGVILPILGAGISVAATMFLFWISGNTMNLVTMMIPPLVFFLSLSAAIHMLAAIRRNIANGDTLRPAIIHACATVGSPCFFACFTTAAGFASLAVSKVSPIRDLAIFGAAGIMISFFAVFLVVPLGYLFLGRVQWLALTPALVRKTTCKPPGKTTCTIAIILSVLIIAGALFSLQWIESDANTLSFFPEDTPVVKAAMLAAEDYSGGTTCEFVIKLKQPYYKAESLEAVRRMQDFLNDQPDVKKTVSYIDLAKAANYSYERKYDPASYALPQDSKKIAGIPVNIPYRNIFLKRLKTELPTWKNYVTSDDKTVRIQTFAHTFSSSKYKSMLDKFRAHLAQLDPAIESATITGSMPLLVETQKNITHTQLNSFAIAFGVIFIVILLIFRSLKTALISLVPNLLPVVVALGMIKVIGATLNIATVLVAGIALGIAVDDTIHFLAHYRRSRLAGKSNSEAVGSTFAVVRRPMITTTLTACAGFGVFCLSEFAPVFYFGVLTSSALGVALLADLYLLPALFLIFDRKNKSAVNRPDV